MGDTYYYVRKEKILIGNSNADICIPDMEKEVCHMIASGMFTGVLELIEHDMKKENAKKYVSTFLDFYIAGWSKILGI